MILYRLLLMGPLLCILIFIYTLKKYTFEYEYKPCVPFHYLLYQVIGCDIPSPFLVVKGFGPFVTEDSLRDLFRQFGVVKSVFILRNLVTGIPKGVAFVEFHTTEHAVHTLHQTSLVQIHLDSSKLKTFFAKESFRLSSISKVTVESRSIFVVILPCDFLCVFPTSVSYFIFSVFP